MATGDPQSRKWLLVINNPQDCGLDHERLKEILSLFHPLYYCMADEIATTGTYHTHGYLYTHSPARFSTLKNRLPTAHIEKAYGTSKENRDYIRKSGEKWAGTEKAETSVPGTSLAMRTDLEPVAAMASPTRMRSLSSARRSMTLTSLLKDICSLKNTGPIFLPGPWVEWSWGTRILVPPSVMMEPSGLKRSHRS